ncbi:MAG: isoaspartyl peptidase/L-asparaginase [Alphaproteobacteria bacterium]
MSIVLIHGGAANFDANAPELATKQAAVMRAKHALDDKNLPALDLVELAVKNLELAPELNAGFGSVIQMDGAIRMDAGICDSDQHYAAVLQIEQTKNPILVARKLMGFGYHSILSGSGARQFADEMGFPRESAFTAERMNEYQEMREEFCALSYHDLAQRMDIINKKKLGTVGAVAIDESGNLAAACSTGGTKYCFPGRVGDTGVFGAGVYCSKHIAVALTGEGDKILRRMTAKLVETLYLQSGDLQQAVDAAAKDLLTAEDGYCGIIAVSSKRQSAHVHSTKFMAFAKADI